MSQFRDELERRELQRPDGLSQILLALIRSEGLLNKPILDVGCGWGRLALALAPEARRILGIDRDRKAIERARTLAKERGVSNVEFRTLDAESVSYRSLGKFEVIMANLCMSDEIIERAASALDSRGCLAFACFHTDQWKETGKSSPFAYDQPRLESVLDRGGFQVEHIEVEQEVVEFVSKEEALWALEGMKPKWQGDGRWASYVAYLDQGGRQLTRSHLIVKARKR